ncbi:MAG: alkaline phosphatase family protein [Bryobacteraceae bacterium]|nr:alkaline phosphatase family protein [Bryobacteraceae bacterium]
MKLVPALLACAAIVSAQAPRPKLVVVVVADQFRYDYLTRFRSEYSGGLARLLKEGAVFTSAHYEHFPTVTAVGHSTILSGATPSVSGIVGNEWFDREAAKTVESITDLTEKTLGAPARKAASPRRLLASTISDELKMAGRRSKALGISIKDRSAILTVGRMADAAYWFDRDTGNFVSSTYYFSDLPPWVNEFNRNRTVDRFLGKEWSPSSAAKDLPPATLFGRLPAKPGRAYYTALLNSSWGNEILIDFAERAIETEKLGTGPDTDVLAISFSSNDDIGHDVGPDAPEVRDVSIATDRQLNRLFDILDKQIGMRNVVVVFTSDHGVAPVPELQKKRRMPGGRIVESAVLKAAEDAVTAKYGPAKWVVGKSGPAPYFDHNLIRQNGLDLAEVQNAAAEAVRSLPAVARVYTREQLKLGHIGDDFIARRVRNGFHYERASDLFVIAAPYWVFDDKAEDTGTSHGSPYNYDSHVPIIIMGRGIRPGVYPARAAVNDIAPTLAEMLQIETPSGSTGRVLTEALAQQHP